MSCIFNLKINFTDESAHGPKMLNLHILTNFAKLDSHLGLFGVKYKDKYANESSLIIHAK